MRGRRQNRSRRKNRDWRTTAGKLRFSRFPAGHFTASCAIRTRPSSTRLSTSRTGMLRWRAIRRAAPPASTHAAPCSIAAKARSIAPACASRQPVSMASAVFRGSAEKRPLASGSSAVPRTSEHFMRSRPGRITPPTNLPSPLRTSTVVAVPAATTRHGPRRIDQAPISAAQRSGPSWSAADSRSSPRTRTALLLPTRERWIVGRIGAPASCARTAPRRSRRRLCRRARAFSSSSPSARAPRQALRRHRASPRCRAGPISAANCRSRPRGSFRPERELTDVETLSSPDRGEHERAILRDPDHLAFGHALAGLRQGDSPPCPGVALQPLLTKRREAFAGKPRENPGDGLERGDKDGGPRWRCLAVARDVGCRDADPIARMGAETHVDADSHDRGARTHDGAGALDQYPAELAPLTIKVIRPFDCHALRTQALERLRGTYRRGEAQAPKGSGASGKTP